MIYWLVILAGVVALWRLDRAEARKLHDTVADLEWKLEGERALRRQAQARQRREIDCTVRIVRPGRGDTHIAHGDNARAAGAVTARGAQPPDLTWLTETDDGVCQPASGCPRCGKAPNPYRRRIPLSARGLYCFGDCTKLVEAKT